MKERIHTHTQHLHKLNEYRNDMIDVKNINNKTEKDPSKYTYGVLNLMCFVLVCKNDDDLIFGIKIYEGEIIWMRLQMDVSFRFRFRVYV